MFRLKTNEEEFMTLENEITFNCSDNKYDILTGDFNTRTAELKGYTQPDYFLSELFDLTKKRLNFFTQLVNLVYMIYQPIDNLWTNT